MTTYNEGMNEVVGFTSGIEDPVAQEMHDMEQENLPYALQIYSNEIAGMANHDKDTNQENFVSIRPGKLQSSVERRNLTL